MVISAAKIYSFYFRAILGVIILSTFLIEILTLHSSKTLLFRQIKMDATSVHLKILELKYKNAVIYYSINERFFFLNARELRLALMALPLMSKVVIRRMWSNESAITILEQHLLSQWDGTQLILKPGGSLLFTPLVVTVLKDLPQLRELNYSEKVVLARFKRFNQLLKPLRIKIAAMMVSDRKAWFLVLSNYIQVYLGCENIDQRFKKLVHVYQKIIGNCGDQVHYIDLRYSNGLALQWRAICLHHSYAEGK